MHWKRVESDAGTDWAVRVSAYEQMGLLLRREGQHALSTGSGDAAHLVPAILEHAGMVHVPQTCCAGLRRLGCCSSPQCCAVLHCAALCCTVLGWAGLGSAVLCCAMPLGVVGSG